MRDELQTLFIYRDGALYWRKTRCGRAVEDQLAGSADTTKGYARRRIFFQGRLQPASRLIWAYHFGEIAEGLFVDHIDGNSLNNDIKNLRLLSPRENARNNKRARSGDTPGVRFNTRDKKWVSYVKESGRQVWLGSFATREQAEQAHTRRQNA